MRTLVTNPTYVAVTQTVRDDESQAGSTSASSATLNSLNMPLLALYVAIWYASSAVCNTSARKLLTIYAPLPLWLCCAQFLVAVVALRIYLFSIKKTPPPPMTTPEARDIFLKVTLVYTVGFVFVNAGYLAVNVSLAETLRSAEPLFSVAFAKLMLKDEPVSTLTMATLIPIVMGGVLSSGGDTSFNMMGFFFVCISNVCFALRSVFTKHLKQAYSGNAIQVFYEISKLGLLLVTVFALLVEVGVLVMEDGISKYSLLPALLMGEGENSATIKSIDFMKTVLVNGMTYAAYNQMSFLVLSMVTMVTHAVGNSLRRIVTIVASVYVFGNPITNQNGLGILLAVGGVIAYSISKSRDEAKARKG